MPRTARVVMPGYPHHVIQRGHNRQPLFSREEHYKSYLRTLVEWKQQFKCKVFAFCLMTNHVHMVIEPGEDPTSLGRLMKRLGGRYTRFINRLEERTGTVWEGRFKSSPIDTDPYLMACFRYIELNPVRAGMVASPAQYPWSSYAHHAISPDLPWLDEHSLYFDLGVTRGERLARYREWVNESIPASELKLIRHAAQRGQLTGGVQFQELVEKRMERRVVSRGRGRPRGKKNKSVPI
ncbi:MAG: transposase [Acidobacteriota bacterium]|nr:transposase [Acidobacteriota bacterium]MDH3785188.1 transposase [Acidobacteriota bacterium]